MNLYNVYENGEIFLQNVGKRQIILSKIGICSETIDKYVDTPRLYKKKYRIEGVVQYPDSDASDSVEYFKQQWDETCRMVRENARKRDNWNMEHGVSAKWCFSLERKAASMKNKVVLK